MTDNHLEDNDAPKSKSQIKREMLALQALGKRLTELSRQQLTQIDLEPRLADAISQYQQINSNGAKRRQMQYIGKLMRDIDVDAIEAAMAKFDASSAIHNRHFHQLEQWRERLLHDTGALTEFLDEYPNADTQRLRQLIRNSHKETSSGNNQGYNRKLFRYIRDITEQA